MRLRFPPSATQLVSAIIGCFAGYCLVQLYWLSPVGYLIPFINRRNAQMLESFHWDGVAVSAVLHWFVVFAKALPVASVLGCICGAVLARRGSARSFVYGALAYPVASQLAQWFLVIQPLEASLNSEQSFLRRQHGDWAVVQLVVFSLFLSVVFGVVSQLKRGKPHNQSFQPTASGRG